MKLDQDVQKRIVTSTKAYLKKNNVTFRFIKVRSGRPVVIVDRETLYDIVDRSIVRGRPILGRYLAQGEKGWLAVVHEQGKDPRRDLSEKLTEVTATKFVLGEPIGHGPRRGRYVMT